MPVTAQSVLTVALIGNPNTGKSTLFSALAGTHQHVGNYPGVTVEKKTGRMAYAKQVYELLDLPGLYSLSPRSRDEMIALDVLLGRQKETAPLDAVISIVDAANLVRNLYLASQVRELGLPMVVAAGFAAARAAIGRSGSGHSSASSPGHRRIKVGLGRGRRAVCPR
jgi:Fe2+ transport system protein B